MTQEEAQQYIQKLNFKDGDILFVDADAVDVRNIIKSFPVYAGRVSVCAVAVPYGKTLAECIAKKENIPA